MNKQKKLTIILSVVLVLLLATAGIWMLTRKAYIPVDNSNLANVEWYNLNDTEFTITTREELYDLAKLSDFYSFEGQTIKLGADIVVNEGNATDWKENAPEYTWFPIKRFGGTFDGQGHTISGLYGKGMDVSMSLFTKSKKSCVLRDFKIENSYFVTAGSAGTASIVSDGGGTLQRIYSNAIVECDGEYCAGLVSIASSDLTMKECWFDGSVNVSQRTAGGLMDFSNVSKVSISNCLNTGSVHSDYSDGGSRTGGLVGVVSKARMTLTDSLNVGKVSSANKYYAGSVIGVYYATSSTVCRNIYTTSESYDVGVGRSGAQGVFTGAPVVMPTRDLTGERAYQWTTLDYAKYWTVVKGSTPMLQYFADEIIDTSHLQKVFDTSWFSESESEFVLTTREQLYGLFYLSLEHDFAGKTVKLGADITINEGKASEWAKNAPSDNWYPIKKFAGTFDGQGHTISGLYIHTNSDQVGLFSMTTVASRIQNFRIINSYFYNGAEMDALMGSVAGRGNGIYDTIYSNVIFESTGKQVGGIVGAVNQAGNNVIRNCWYDGSITMKTDNGIYAGGIVSNIVVNGITIEHCLNTADISFEAKDKGIFVGGLVAVTMNGGTRVQIKDCLSVGKITGPYDVCVGAVIGRHNKNVTLNIEDSYTLRDSYVHPNNGFMSIGTQSSSEYTGSVVGYNKDFLVGYGGYEWTTLDFKDYWAVQLGGTPILKSFAKTVPSIAGRQKKFDISWYKADSKSYTLDSAKDLYGFYMISSGTDFAGKTVKLGADITVNEAGKWETSWNPIKKFAGTFDGQGHTIRGLYVKTDETGVGFFNVTTEESKIANLKLEDSYFEYTGGKTAKIGSIAGTGRGTFDTIYSNATVVSNGSTNGGLIGLLDEDVAHTIKNCWFAGNLTTSGQTAGGLAGFFVKGTAKVEDCLSTGNIISTYTNGVAYVGGLIGNFGSGCKKLSMSNCLNQSNITVSEVSGIGSVVGRARAPVTFTNVYTTDCVSHIAGKSIGRQSTVSGVGNYSTNGGNKIIGSPEIRTERSLVDVMAFDTELDFSVQGKWVARIEKTPALKSFVPTGEVLAEKTQIVADTGWYTKNPNSKTYEIKTAAELYGLVELSKQTDFKGKTIELKAPITVNIGDAADWGTQAPQYRWKPIRSFAGTFQGNGYTISGIYMKTGTTNGGLFQSTTKDAKLQNFRLENSYFEYMNEGKAKLGSVVGTGAGTFDTIYSNAILVSNGTFAGGLIGYIDGDASHKITNCWFNGKVSSNVQYIGGLVGAVQHGTLAIVDCLYTGELISTFEKADDTVTFAGGFVGYVGTNTTEVKIAQSLSAGSVTISAAKGVTKGGTGSVIGRARKPVVLEDTYTLDAIWVVGEGTVGIQSTVRGVGNYSTNSGNSIKGYAYVVTAEKIMADKALDNTTLNFDTDGKWTARTAKTPALKSFVPTSEVCDLNAKIVADTAWYTKEPNAKEFYISTAAELYGLSEVSKTESTGFKGKTIYLTDDITVNRGSARAWADGEAESANSWTPISLTGTAFNGTFDGQGYTISGICTETTTARVGLFAETGKDAVIRNFRLANSYFAYVGTSTAVTNVGSITGIGKGTFDTIYSDAIVGNTSKCTGGLIGQVMGNCTHKIQNCWFDGHVFGALNNIGGLVGYITGVTTQTVTIENCLNSGRVERTQEYTESTSDKTAKIGGFVGYYGGSNMLYIQNCVDTGTIVLHATGNITIGNVGSYVGQARSKVSFNECVYTLGVIEKGEQVSIDTTSSKEGVGSYSTNSNEITGKADKKTSKEMKDSNAFALNLDFAAKGAWVARTENTPALRSFVVDSEVHESHVVADTYWYDCNPEASTYYLTTPEDLYGLVELSRTYGFAGKIIKLNGNIVVNEGKASDWNEGKNIPVVDWVPISEKEDGVPWFNGTFDGQGYTISGLYANTTSPNMGLFGATTVNAKIQNLRIENSYFQYTGKADDLSNIGSIVGSGKGKFTNIYSDAYVVSDGKDVGGLIGIMEGSYAHQIRNCTFNGVVASASTNIGGLVGLLRSVGEEQTVTIANCVNSGTVSSSYTYTSADSNKNVQIGGFVGYYGGSHMLHVTDCTDTGTVIVRADSEVEVGRIGSLIGCARSPITFNENVYTAEKISVIGGGTIDNSNTAIGLGSYSTNSNTIIGEAKKYETKN